MANLYARGAKHNIRKKVMALSMDEWNVKFKEMGESSFTGKKLIK